MSYKANYDKAVSLTIFAAAATEAAPLPRGIGVVFDANAHVVAAGAGVIPNFITMDTAVYAGEAIQGAIPNGAIVVVAAGDAVPLGDVTTDANGKFIAATTGDEIVGSAVTTADAENEFFAIQFFPRGAKA